MIKKTIYNNEQVLNIRKERSPKIYNSTNYRTHIDYLENNLYTKSDNRTFNNTTDTYKIINQNTTEVVNTYRVNTHLKLKGTYYNINDNVAIHKNNTIHTNDTRNVTKHNKLFNVTDNNYYAKKLEHTNNITNNITKHNHNNYEHNVIKTVNTHIHHINNFYNDTFNFRKPKTFHYRNKQIS